MKPVQLGLLISVQLFKFRPDYETAVQQCKLFEFCCHLQIAGVILHSGKSLPLVQRTQLRVGRGNKKFVKHVDYSQSAFAPTTLPVPPPNLLHLHIVVRFPILSLDTHPHRMTNARGYLDRYTHNTQF